METTFKQRIAERSALLERLQDEMQQCRRNVAAERARYLELARRYNMAFGSLGYLTDSEQ